MYKNEAQFLYCGCRYVIGGHTSEILRLLAAVDLKTYVPRHYIIADTDKISEQKVRSFEENVPLNETQQNVSKCICFVIVCIVCPCPCGAQLSICNKAYA